MTRQIMCVEQSTAKAPRGAFAAEQRHGGSEGNGAAIPTISLRRNNNEKIYKGNKHGNGGGYVRRNDRCSARGGGRI